MKKNLNKNYITNSREILMSKELIKELIAGTVDGDYHSFAKATSAILEAQMKDILGETVADIKLSMFVKKNDDNED